MGKANRASHMDKYSVHNSDCRNMRAMLQVCRAICCFRLPSPVLRYSLKLDADYDMALREDIKKRRKGMHAWRKGRANEREREWKRLWQREKERGKIKKNAIIAFSIPHQRIQNSVAKCRDPEQLKKK